MSAETFPLMYDGDPASLPDDEVVFLGGFVRLQQLIDQLDNLMIRLHSKEGLQPNAPFDTAVSIMTSIFDCFDETASALHEKNTPQSHEQLRQLYALLLTVVGKHIRTFLPRRTPVEKLEAYYLFPCNDYIMRNLSYLIYWDAVATAPYSDEAETYSLNPAGPQELLDRVTHLSTEKKVDHRRYNARKTVEAIMNAIKKANLTHEDLIALYNVMIDGFVPRATQYRTNEVFFGNDQSYAQTPLESAVTALVRCYHTTWKKAIPEGNTAGVDGEELGTRMDIFLDELNTSLHVIEELKARSDSLGLWLHAPRLAAKHMIQAIQIHPFNDGNGRFGMTIAALIMARAGKKIQYHDIYRVNIDSIKKLLDWNPLALARFLPQFALGWGGARSYSA